MQINGTTGDMMPSKARGKVQLRTCQAEISARLNSTPQGKALIDLLAMYPSRQNLADAMGSSLSYISLCVRNGQISKAGALLADEAGIMSKEKLRPDLSADDWSATQPGLSIGHKVEMTEPQQILLRDLAAHFGSVKSFCRTTGIQIRTFHNWRTRGVISSHGLLKLLALKGLTADLRARIKELQK